MISKGHFIGEIIDMLGDIKNQVNLRSQVGFFDLNRVLEDTFMHLLNHILKLKLTNLNAKRINELGIDLGDVVNRIAFQITTTKTSEKINDTLIKITDCQKKDYDKFIVLIVGKKQGKYTLNKDLELVKKKYLIKMNISGISLIYQNSLCL